MNATTLFDTIEAAERSLTEAGYTRDVNRAVWVHPAGKPPCRVVRAFEPGKFAIQ